MPPPRGFPRAGSAPALGGTHRGPAPRGRSGGKTGAGPGITARPRGTGAVGGPEQHGCCSPSVPTKPARDARPAAPAPGLAVPAAPAAPLRGRTRSPRNPVIPAARRGTAEGPLGDNRAAMGMWRAPRAIGHPVQSVPLCHHPVPSPRAIGHPVQSVSLCHHPVPSPHAIGHPMPSATPCSLCPCAVTLCRHPVLSPRAIHHPVPSATPCNLCPCVITPCHPSPSAICHPLPSITRCHPAPGAIRHPALLHPQPGCHVSARSTGWGIFGLPTGCRWLPPFVRKERLQRGVPRLYPPPTPMSRCHA